MELVLRVLPTLWPGSGRSALLTVSLGRNNGMANKNEKYYKEYKKCNIYRSPLEHQRFFLFH